MALPQVISGILGGAGSALNLDWLPKLVHSLSALNAPAEFLTKNLDLLQKPMQALGTSAAVAGDKITKILDVITHRLGATATTAASAVASITLPFKAMTSVLGGAGNAIGEFTKKANPAQFQKFELAMDDLMAVIGKALAPAMEFITGIVRMLADTFMILIEPIQKLLDAILKPLMTVFEALFSAIAPILEIIGQLVETFASVLGPVLEAFAAIIKVIFAVLEPFLRIIQALLEPFMDIIKEIGKVIGEVVKEIVKVIETVVRAMRSLFGGDRKRPSSVGAAARPATISGVEEYGKKAQQAAFSLGITTENYQKTSSEYLKRIFDFIERKFGKADSRGISGAGIEGVEAGREVEGRARAPWWARSIVPGGGLL